MGFIRGKELSEEELKNYSCTQLYSNLNLSVNTLFL